MSKPLLVGDRGQTDGRPMALTVAQFRRLRPRSRGYAVYLLGAREDQPNVPDEENPYPIGSRAARAWDDGQDDAARDAQDGDD